MLVELTYDDKMMHGDWQSEISWFYNNILLQQGETDTLILH